MEFRVNVDTRGAERSGRGPHRGGDAALGGAPGEPVAYFIIMTTVRSMLISTRRLNGSRAPSDVETAFTSSPK